MGTTFPSMDGNGAIVHDVSSFSDREKNAINNEKNFLTISHGLKNIMFDSSSVSSMMYLLDTESMFSTSCTCTIK